MRRALCALTLWGCVAGWHAPAQQNTAPPAASGLETDWDIAVTLRAIAAHAARVLPALDRADAGSWTRKGAPEAYAAQLQSAKDQAHAITADAVALAADPERLALSLGLLFRTQALTTLLASVAEAVRNYQDPAQAQALIALAAEGDPSREHFQQYIVNLAAEREKELAVMDQEAQRCRALVTAPAPAASGKKKK
jgi:hypothetical protein